MNIVDLALIFLILLSVLFGIYRGFLRSMINVLVLLLSFALALWISPLLSRVIAAKENSILYRMIEYTEGASRIPSIEEARMDVAELTEDEINELVEAAAFTDPIPKLLKKNLTEQAYRKDGLITVEEYFNRSLVDITLNLFSCFVLAVFFYILFSILVACVDYVVQFPVLAIGDGVFGAVFGALRGVLLCMILFLAVPAVLSVIPSNISVVEKLVNGSTLFGWFIRYNFFLMGIRGTV